MAIPYESLRARFQLVEPGYGPTTRFAANGGSRMEGLMPEAYQDFARPIFEAFGRPGMVTTEVDVADAVFRAATDGTA